MKKTLKILLPGTIKTDVAFKGKQLSSCFNIEDKTEFPHKHDLAQYAECPEEIYNNYNVGEMARHICESVIVHSEERKFIKL